MESICIASSPALIAPAFPIAVVATGTPQAFGQSKEANPNHLMFVIGPVHR